MEEAAPRGGRAGRRPGGADAALAPSSAPPKPGETAKPAAFPSPFKTTADYVAADGWRKGGDNSLFAIRKHQFFLRHSPHYDIIQVQPALNQTGGPGGAPRGRCPTLPNRSPASS